MHAKAHKAEHDAQADNEPCARKRLKPLRLDEPRQNKIAEQHPDDDHQENDDRGLDAGCIYPAAVLDRRVFCVDGQGVAVEMRDFSRGGCAEHTADSREQRDEQRLHADAAKA